MVDQDTIDKIQGWATNKYSSAPTFGATTTATPATDTGMLGAASDTPGTTKTTTDTAGTTTAPASMWDAAVQQGGSADMGAAAPASPAPASNTAPTAAPANWWDQPLETKKYGGQDVLVGDREMQNLKDGADNWNKTTGQNLTAQQYDYMLNPKTAGARWGEADPGAPATNGVAHINPADLAARTIDPANETVRGQLGQVLAEDSPVLQQARADAMRSANERGMVNSTMATSGAEDAVIRSALNIASPDASTYGHAADYNVAAKNQASMFNATADNDFAKFQMQLDADNKARGQQMTIAQMQDATTRFNAEQSAATSKYNTDSQYKQQADSAKRSLANNIIANMDLSPDRKAAMLESLGEGTSAKKNPDGTITPGTGLAGAVYVIDSVAADLNFSNEQAARNVAGMVI